VSRPKGEISHANVTTGPGIAHRNSHGYPTVSYPSEQRVYVAQRNHPATHPLGSDVEGDPMPWRVNGIDYRGHAFYRLSQYRDSGGSFWQTSDTYFRRQGSVLNEPTPGALRTFRDTAQACIERAVREHPSVLTHADIARLRDEIARNDAKCEELQADIIKLQDATEDMERERRIKVDAVGAWGGDGIHPSHA